MNILDKVSMETYQAAICYARLVKEKRELEKEMEQKARELICGMQMDGATSIVDDDILDPFAIDMCVRKTFAYPESVKQIESTLKREKELAVLTGVATVATETTFLRVR